MTGMNELILLLLVKLIAFIRGFGYSTSGDEIVILGAAGPGICRVRFIVLLFYADSSSGKLYNIYRDGVYFVVTG